VLRGQTKKERRATTSHPKKGKLHSKRGGDYSICIKEKKSILTKKQTTHRVRKKENFSPDRKTGKVPNIAAGGQKKKKKRNSNPGGTDHVQGGGKDEHEEEKVEQGISNLQKKGLQWARKERGKNQETAAFHVRKKGKTKKKLFSRGGGKRVHYRVRGTKKELILQPTLEKGSIRLQEKTRTKKKGEKVGVASGKKTGRGKKDVSHS